MDDLFLALGIIVLIFIPTLALTARFALRPIVEAIIRLREGLLGDPSRSIETDRMAAIESELAELRQEVRALADVREFHRELAVADHQPRLQSGQSEPHENSSVQGDVAGDAAIRAEERKPVR